MQAEPWNEPGTILIGKSERYEHLRLDLANRHGLIAGATGTGKTVTLQKLAEGFSNAGVPVFLSDVKGDLAGLAAAGEPKPALQKRCEAIGVPFEADRFPVVFWDVFGQQGHPLRATIAEMGPLLVGRMLSLNETQQGVLAVAFRVADEQKLPLLDLKDLRAMLGFVADHAGELRTRYGNIASTSVGAIQRQLLVLEQQGADQFLGEPALAIADFMRTDRDGRGTVNILAADALMRRPLLYATFLLWLLSELFEDLPEVGDLAKPKLVFFFDEAHLLFDNAPASLMQAIEQVVRLIRSKGVGIYFITQNPLDVPDAVLGQLGNRVQHALRAFTPRDQRAVKAAADTFRRNPAFDAAEAITQLGVGEALVSTLQVDGTPAPVTKTLVAVPSSRVGPITAEERQAVQQASLLGAKYDTPIDRDSAFEMLAARTLGGQQQAGQAAGSPWAPAPAAGHNPWGQAGQPTGAAPP
ncbi:DUF853 family protein, partial [Lichenihabitans sp. Uapishka_5]|uniref:helicase HerA-like domain-containing protein n=1 Tax=Lichenihabitans sp. Uapishka_5 TaxID=3037302 RepID=UPI0029E7F070